MLPTPLSPAVGSRRNAYRLTFSRAGPERSAALYRPALAPVPVPSGSWVRSEDRSLASRRFRDRSSCLASRAALLVRRLAIPRNRAGSSGLPTARPRGFNAPGIDGSEDPSFPFAPPRGISPSRRNRFQNLFFFQGFTPSIRRANPRSRWIEDAPRDRVGQASDTRVIHFQAKQRWTRVDKSTVRRKSSSSEAVGRKKTTDPAWPTALAARR